MSLFLVTGVEGSGKSNICTELSARGFESHGIDEEGIAGICSIETGQRVSYPRNPIDRSPEWRQQHQWRMSPELICDLVEQSIDKTVFACGNAENEFELWEQFDGVFALVLDAATVASRLTNREGKNNYGKAPHELDAVLVKLESIQEQYIERGALVIDATQPASYIADQIVASI